MQQRRLQHAGANGSGTAPVPAATPTSYTVRIQPGVHAAALTLRGVLPEELGTLMGVIARNRAVSIACHLEEPWDEGDGRDE